MSAELFESIDRLRHRLAVARRAGASIGLVPTMGALHAGHASLIARARADSDLVLVTIFVNPLQFDRPDDLTRYPRTLDADRRLCDELDVEAIFAPTVEEMYPTPAECTIDLGHLADHLCGPRRPGHFRGVATVVLKLFGIAQPDRAYFGEKDAQQLAIIRRMVADLNVPLAIVGVPTVREPDGLALSSRNRHLTPAERPLAIHLYRALLKAKDLVERGDTDPAAVTRLATAEIPTGTDALRLEYFEIVDSISLQPAPEITAPVRIAGAMWVGTTRLIDNVLVTPPH